MKKPDGLLRLGMSVFALGLVLAVLTILIGGIFSLKAANTVAWYSVVLVFAADVALVLLLLRRLGRSLRRRRVVELPVRRPTRQELAVAVAHEAGICICQGGKVIPGHENDLYVAWRRAAEKILRVRPTA